MILKFLFLSFQKKSKKSNFNQNNKINNYKKMNTTEQISLLNDFENKTNSTQSIDSTNKEIVNENNKRYCIIPIQVNNNTFQLVLMSYDLECIHQSWLVQSPVSHPLKQFLNTNNHFQKKYYQLNQFPISGLKKLQSFSFGFFKGTFQENYFKNHELTWYKREEFYLLEPRFVSIPFTYPTVPLSKINQPFSIAFQLSYNLQLKCSSIRFLLIEQMHLIEEQSFDFNQFISYCTFNTPFNKITSETYLKIEIDLLSHKQLYIDGGCYLFDEYGYLLTEKSIQFSRRSRLRMNAPTIKAMRTGNDLDKQEFEEQWDKMEIILKLSKLKIGYSNNTIVKNDEKVVYDNGHVYSIENYKQLKDLRTNELIENTLNTTVFHKEIGYFSSDNTEMEALSTINGLLFGNIIGFNEEWLTLLKEIRSDVLINKTFLLEIVKRRYYILKELDLECCKSCLIALRQYSNYGENHIKQCCDYFYNRIKQNKTSLTVFETLMFSESGFINLSLKLSSFIEEKQLIELPKLLLLFIVSLKEKGNELQERLKTIYSKPENKELFIKFLWMLLQYDQFYETYIHQWFEMFNQLFSELYPNDVKPSVEIIEGLIELFNDETIKENDKNPTNINVEDILKTNQQLIHPFCSSPITQIISKRKGTTLESPVTIHFKHLDGKESILLHKDNYKTIESNILLYEQLISKLCNASYQFYDIFNYKENKFVEFIPNCLSYRDAKSIVNDIVNVPIRRQLSESIDISENEEILKEFTTIHKKFEIQINQPLEPQYIRKKNMFESAALSHIFWCLCCLVDRHQKNILYNPLNGNFFHIDHTFPSSHFSQIMHPIQYWMTNGIFDPFKQCKSEHILKLYITNYMNIILENKGKIYSFLQMIRRSNVFQIDRMCEIMFLKDIHKFVLDEQLLEMFYEMQNRYTHDYAENIIFK